MELKDCIKTRRSVRKYLPQSVEREDIKAIIESARYSPTWKNGQICRYTVIDDKSVIENIAQNATMGFEHNKGILKECYTVAIISYVTKMTGYNKDGTFTTKKGDSWEMFDCGIATQNFCLAAHDMGVGTCIMGIFDGDKVAEIIDLPENESVGAIVSMGYFEEEYSVPQRKSVEELLRFI